MPNPNSTNMTATKPALKAIWPKWLRRGSMESIACGVITLGILMLLQPFALILYTWSFVTMLFGTVMFMVVSKFPQ
jgi:hypothetical protein